MKNLKKEISLLLVLALVISSLAMGFGQVKASAYTDALGTGIFRVDIAVRPDDCAPDYGGASHFRLQCLNASGSVVSTTADNALDGPLTYGTTTSYTYNGMTYGYYNVAVPSLGTMEVNKTITQVQLVNTSSSGFWYFNSVTIYFSNDGGINWVTLGSNSWSSGGTAGNTDTFAVSYFSSNYKTLTFNANGGSGGGTYDAIPGQTISAPANPTKRGDTFAGWSPSFPARMPNADTTYTAQWTPTYRDITFDANGGTGGTGPNLMAIGSALTAPTVTKDGYTFKAWSPSVPSTVPGVDKTYTAIWLANGESNENIFNITYDPNGGSGTMLAQSLSFGQTAALSNNEFVKTGNTFLGWASSQAIADLGAIEYLNGENYTIANDITLYAVWLINSYTITFSANGGSGGRTFTMLYGAALSAPTVTKTGYTCTGWSPAIPATVPAENTTYTAQWTANTYAVTFDAQSGSVSPTASTVTYGSTYALGTGGFPTPTRTGYTFGGWYTSTGGAGTNILSTSTVTITASKTLYAKWTAITYTVSYHGNGSTGGSTASSTHYYGTAKALTVNGFTKTGNAFIGWATSEDGAVVYSDGQSVSSLTSTNGATVTLYAKWTDVNVFTITFDANGGTGGKSTLMVAGAALTAPTVTKTGYTLAGWSPAVPVTVPAGDATYTAQWTANTYTVVYGNDTSTGGSTANSTHTYDSPKALNLNGYIRTGYSFMGWATSSGGAVVYSDGQSVLNLTSVASGTKSLWPVWSGRQYTVTFDAQGGSVSPAASTVTYGSTYAAGTGGFQTPTRTGYTFGGWYTVTGGAGTKILSTTLVTITADQTLYAKWTINTYTVSYNGNGSTGGSTASSSHTCDVAKVLTANGFTKTGYTFTGWAASADGAVVYSDGQSVTNLTATNGATVTLYAKWTINSYSITFEANGGSATAPVTQDYNTSAEKPTDPLKDGFNFGGWYSDPEFITPVIWPITVTQSSVFYAEWNAENCYRIIFAANGGIGGTSASMSAGDPLTAPTVTKNGYTFAGWSPIVPNAVPAERTIYSAQWTVNTYTVSYDGNGNDAGSMASSSHTYDTASALTSNGFTKVGNSFLGWSTSQSATTAAYTNGQSVLNLTPNQGEIITFFAVWSVNSYTITFSANGGSGGTSSSMQYSSVLSAPTVTKNGNTFASWSPAVPSTVPAANTTYTAQWTANTYTVTFDAQGGSVSPETSTVTYGSTYSAGTGGLPTPARTGCTFSGWYISTFGAGTNILSSSTVTTTATQTLYAKWTYTVSYNGNGSTGGSTASSTHTYGVAKALTTNGFTKTDFSFLGWATDPLATTPDYTNGQSVVNLTTAANASIILYAVWSATNHYTVTFDAQGGSVSPATSIVTYGSTYGAGTGGLPTPTRTGYHLFGWYTNPSGTGSQITSNTQVTITAAQTLYAKWNVNIYYISYNGNGSTGGSTASSTHTYGVAKALTANSFIKSGYAFEGWATSSVGPVVYADGQSVSNLSATDVATVTLYAKWTVVNAYTITFDANGGTGGKSTTLIAGAALTAPTVIKTGCTFTGWSPIVPASVPAENTTYTAQWTVYNYMVNYDGNGSTGGSTASSSHTYNVAANITANGFTKIGYRFLGWATGPDLVGAAYADGQSVINLTSSPNGVITFYAVWSGNEYTITFDANGGTGGSSTLMQCGAVLTPPTVTRAGYGFVGWSPSVHSTVPAENTTYTAQWITGNYYTITFDANGGTGGYSIAMYPGSPLTAPTVTRTGYTLIGWSPAMPATVPAADTTYIAQWDLTPVFTYTVENSQATVTNYTGPSGNITIPSALDGYPVTALARKSGDLYGVFSGCTSPTVVTLPDTVKTIGDYAFYNCTGLTWINIPNSVTTIGKWAFRKCNELTSLTIPASVTSIAATAFLNDTKLLNIFVDSGNEMYLSQDGVLFNKELSTIIACPAGKTGGYIIPNSVTKINDNAFYECVGLTSIKIPESVTTIGAIAFYGCSGLTTLTLPSKLVSIGDDAFWYLTRLKELYFLGNAPSMGVKVFVSLASGFTIYYLIDKIGFTNPWNEYPTAIFSPVSTITFDANGGTGGTSASMTYGATLTAPTVTKAGCTFSGWSPAVPATVPAADTTYTAQWSANTYTVNYNGNSSTTGSTASSSHTYDVYATLTANGFAKTGSSFLGWSTDSGATTAAYTDAQSVVNLTESPNGVVTFYAVWAAIQHTVTFNSNGGAPVTAITQNENTMVAKPADPTKTGYTFGGWYSNVGLTTAVSWPHTLTGDVTFYAKWNIPNYVLTFALNDGTGGIYRTYNLPAGTIVYFYPDYSGYPPYPEYVIRIVYPGGNGDGFGFEPQVIYSPPTRQGYTFLGWSCGMQFTMPAHDSIINAVWSQNSPVNITFDTNGGSAIAPTTGYAGDPLTAPLGPTRAGYTFAGWVPAIPSTVPNNDATYTAEWDINTYTIFFQSNGGSSVSLVNQIYNTAVSKPADPTKTGYTFGGWYLNAELTTAVSWPYTLTGDVTFNAKWTVNDPIYTFKPNGGTWWDGTTGDKVIGGSGIGLMSFEAPGPLTRTGYSFAGWSPAIPATMPAADSTFTAQWVSAAADYTQLNSWLADAEGLNRDIYTPESLAAVDDALADAYEAVAAEYQSPMQGTVDEIAFALANALAGLEIITDPELSALIALAQAENLPVNAAHDPAYMVGGERYITGGFTNNGYYPRGMFTSSSITALEEAVITAKSTIDPMVYPPIDKHLNLLLAVNNLELESADYTELTIYMSQAESLNRGFYSAEDLASVDEAMGYAYDAMQYKKPTQESVDAAAILLQGVLWELPADISAINNTWNDFQANYVQSNYTPESWDRVVSYYNDIIGWNLPSYLQSDVEQINENLIAVISLLELRAVTYTVKYQTAGGVTLHEDLSYGATATDLITENALEITGYTPAQAIIQKTMTGIDSENIIIFSYSANLYTITFDANGGAGGIERLFDFGQALTAPAVTRASYVFIGWSQAVPATVGPENANFSALWNLLGDLNSSDSITPIDALMTLQAASGKITLTDIQRLAADIDSSGTISPIDALKILQYTSGKISSFEI